MYQPRPIEKRSAAPQRPQPRVERPVASIVINVETLTQLSDERARREAEVVETLAGFIPLSSTPAPARFTEELPAARALVRERPVDLSALEGAPRRAEDFSSSARRARLTGALALIAIWGSFLVSRVGLERALREPLRSSRVALLGEIETKAEVDNTEIEELVESGEVSARVVRVVVARGRVAVEGEVENSTSRAQGNIQLALKVSFKGPPPYTESLTLPCCEEAPAEVTEAWLAEHTRQRATPAAVKRTRIPSGGRSRFVHVLQAPRGRAQTPEVTAAVSFYESAE
jgi:hypothetical protein